MLFKKAEDAALPIPWYPSEVNSTRPCFSSDNFKDGKAQPVNGEEFFKVETSSVDARPNANGNACTSFRGSRICSPVGEIPKIKVL